jgi:TolB-like protein
VLLKHGVRLRLRDQSFRILVALLQRPWQVVTREELRHLLWPDEVFVDFDNSLNTAVGRLREALGDAADAPRFIETLSKRGYRFIGSVSVAPAGQASAPSPGLRLVILPFVNASGDRLLDYLADSMTDGIITEVASAAPSSVHVIARSTAMHYKGTHKDVARIGRELAVDYIVEGSAAVSPDGSRLGLTVQLTRVADETDVWARRLESARSEMVQLQGAIARDIIGHLPAPPVD